MTQAALGAQVSVNTLEGPEEIAVASGTQSGAVFRLRGRGVPHTNGRGRGDLHIHLAVDTPTDLNGETDQLLRKLAEVRGESVNDAPQGLFKKIKSAFS
jgi:molecular chaperone DnaJ